jgi:predicted nucleic acid-binding protein
VTPVVVDASALAALLFQEPGFERIAARLRAAAVHAPVLLKLELANVALVKARRKPDLAPALFTMLAEAVGQRSDIQWHDVDAADVALVAQATGLSAYDASYLWLAGTLGADLVTLDKKLSAAVE